MGKITATIILVILTTAAFSAGVWAAYGFTWYSVGKVDYLPSVLFIAFFPAPLVFVWRSLRDRYDFGKKRFYLCAIVPQYVVSFISSAILLAMGANADGWGGIAVLVFVVMCIAATIGLVVAMVAWLGIGECCERIKSDRVRKALAIIGLAICGVFIFGVLRRLLDLRFLDLISVVRYTDQTPHIVSFINGTIPKAVILAIPLGFGASALSRVYREEYKLKAPLFILIAFAPTLLISGGLLAARYYKFPDLDYYLHKFIDPIETAIFTATVALASAILSAISAIIRSKRHYY